MIVTMPVECTYFTVETLEFLRDLKANNQREWFQARKDVYETAIKAPCLAFAAALSEHIATVAPEYATLPEKAVQRIYRDVRFSSDKTPYRTELGFLFTHRSLGKKAGCGVYVSISAEAVQIAGGLYQQDAPGLYAIRQHLLTHATAFDKLLSGKALRNTFGSLQGDSLKRPPRGFSPQDPSIELLKRTQWLLESSLRPEAVCQPSFRKEISSRIGILLPFVRFFEAPLLVRAKPLLLDGVSEEKM